MTIQAKIKTDLRVRDLVNFFQNCPKWHSIHEIDSINCGEGFDLRYNETYVRIYDCDRSDEVLLHEDYKSGRNYEEVFNKVMWNMRGKTFLYVEIENRFGKPNHDEQKSALESLKLKLSQNNLFLDEIEFL